MKGEDEFKAFLSVMEDKEFSTKYPELHKLRKAAFHKNNIKMIRTIIMMIIVMIIMIIILMIIIIMIIIMITTIIKILTENEKVI